jgi:hypothetical protein
MKMINQTNELHHYDQKTRLIRAQVGTVLTKWGLLPRFKRWRLTQDTSTGLIVLFGILNNRFIAMHTSIPFSNYFDPHLLRDLENELQLQVVTCNSDGLRYAFILERGFLVKLPKHIDYPFLEEDKLYVRVVYSAKQEPEPQSIPALETRVDPVVEQTMVNQGVVALLNVFDDIKLKGEAAAKLPAEGLPEVIAIDEEEFNKQVAEHKVVWQRSHPN